MISIILSVLLTQASAPAAIIASDVATVAETFAAIEEAAAAEAPDAVRLEAALVRAMERGCDAVLRESGLREVDPADRRALSTMVADEAAQRARAALAAEPRDRRTVLADLGRRVTTRDLPASLVDRWLGFGDQPAARAPRAEGRSAAAQVPGSVQPAATQPAAPAQGPSGLASQLSALGGGSADLKLVPDHAVLREDLGGPGAGNGVIDAGEWVRVELAVVNASARAWFSTSAFVRADGGCLWAQGTGAEIAELAPGAETVVPAWLYVSRECSGGARRFRVGLRDSLRSPTVEVELVAQLTPVEVPAPRVVNARLDTDDLGSSDGSRRRELAPGLRFEHSLDLLGVVEGATAHTSYSVPTDLRPLFKGLSFRNEPLLRDAEKVLRAADDLDGEVVPQPAYGKALAAVRQSRRWVVERTPGQLWLGVDVDLKVPPPGSKPAPPAAVKPADPKPIPEAVVVGLVRRHLSLEPHPVPAVLPGAAVAAAGYEVVFDTEAFLAAYRAALKPTETAAAPHPEPAPLSYRYRVYLPLALEVPQVARPTPAPPKVVVAQAPKPIPAPEPVEATPPSLRLDLGLGLLSLGSGNPGTTSVSALDLRLRLGGTGTWAVFGGLSRANDSTSTYSETAAHLGIGYNARLAPAAILMPWASLVALIGKSSFEQQASGFGLELGATLRLSPKPNFGFFLEGAARLGPSFVATSGKGGRFEAGLYFDFGGSKGRGGPAGVVGAGAAVGGVAAAAPSTAGARVAKPAAAPVAAGAPGAAATPVAAAAPAASTKSVSAPPPGPAAVAAEATVAGIVVAPPDPPAPSAPAVAAPPPVPADWVPVQVRAGAVLRAQPNEAAPVVTTLGGSAKGMASPREVRGHRRVRLKDGTTGWALSTEVR